MTNEKLSLNHYNHNILIMTFSGPFLKRETYKKPKNKQINKHIHTQKKNIKRGIY